MASCLPPTSRLTVTLAGPGSGKRGQVGGRLSLTGRGGVAEHFVSRGKAQLVACGKEHRLPEEFPVQQALLDWHGRIELDHGGRTTKQDDGPIAGLLASVD